MGDTVRSRLSNLEHQVNIHQTNKEELRQRLLKASWVYAEDEEENQRYERFQMLQSLAKRMKGFYRKFYYYQRKGGNDESD